MKILLFGKSGQVGWELNRSLQPLGEVFVFGRKEADFSNPDSLRDIVREIKPDVIVNAVAYTAVDKAEKEEELAGAINSSAPGVLAEVALEINALLVHYSTDYVFDGTKESPYVESDEPNPINAYGRTKLAGERAIQLSGCDYLILRTTWVYASRGSNFLRTILRLANDHMELRIVSDQHGAPTWARNISDITGHVLVSAQQERYSGKFGSGIYHLCASGESTWYDFADAIIEQAKILDTEKSIVTEKVLPIATEDYPLPAPRPKNSQLDSSLLMARFGVTMPDWRNAMKLCVDEVLERQ